MNNTRQFLLITTAAAALIAGAGLASAQGTNNLPEKSPAAPTAQAPVKEQAAPTAQAPVKEKTAQAPVKEQSAPTAQAPVKDKTAPTAQAPTKEKPPAPTAQAPTKEPLTARDEMKPGAPAALSAEQHAKVWDTLRGEKTERLTNVRFSTTVGEVVPGTVHLYTMPVSIVEYAPQYRDYEYILVGDEILIVDPRTLRIVAVIAA